MQRLTALHQNVLSLNWIFGSAHGIQLTCCIWNPNCTTPSEFSEVGGSLVSEENQLPFQMSLGEPGGSSKSQKKKMITIKIIKIHQNPIPKTKNKKIHDTKVLLPRTPSLITGPASSGSRPDRITMRVESGWCDPKFHGFSKTQNKGNTSAHTYSKYLKIS